MATTSDDVYRVIANIPECFQSVDIRNYFSFLTEQDSFFKFYYSHIPETHLMGIIIRLKAEVSKVMDLKGFKLSDRNPKKFVNVADDIFHSANCSDQEDEDEDDQHKDITDSLARINITDERTQHSFKKRDIVTKESKSSDKLLLETKNYRKNDQQNSLLDAEDSFSEDTISDSGNCVNDSMIESKENRRFCAVIKVKKEFDEMLKKCYHQKFWVDVNGNILPIRCLILDFDSLQLVMDYVPSGKHLAMKTLTTDEVFEEALRCTHTHLDRSSIFNYENYILPRGNIGETNEHVEELLQKHSMNLSLMKELGIKFKVDGRVRRFCKLPFIYNPIEGAKIDDFPRVLTANSDVIPSPCDIRQINRREDLNFLGYSNQNGNDENESSVMDWHTYEEFYNATREKEMNREVDFKEDIEILLETGNCGIVQYFDGQFWHQRDGGEEMRALERWVIDTKVDLEKKDLSDSDRVKLIKEWEERNEKKWTGLGSLKGKGSLAVRMKRKCEVTNALAPYDVRESLSKYMSISWDPRHYHCPLGKPESVSQTMWDKCFKASYEELYGPDELHLKREKNDDGEAKQSRGAASKERRRSKGRGKLVKAKKSQKNYNVRTASNYNGNYNPPLLSYPYGGPIDYDRGLLPLPFQPQINKSSMGRYDMLGYDVHGRSVFDRYHDIGCYDYYDRYAGASYRPNRQSVLHNDPRFLASQGFSDRSIDMMLGSRFNDFYDDYYDEDYDGYVEDDSNYRYRMYERNFQKTKDSEVDAPTAKYENDGNFTSGVSLLHPSSSCIVKAAFSKPQKKDLNGGMEKTEDDVVIEVKED